MSSYNFVDAVYMGYRAALNSMPHRCGVCEEVLTYDQDNGIGYCGCCNWNTEMNDDFLE